MLQSTTPPVSHLPIRQCALQGKRHPAEALLSPRDPNEESQPQRRNIRRGAADASGGDQPSRGRGRGNRGARGGGRGMSQDAMGGHDQPRARNANGAASRIHPSTAAWNLFSADSRTVRLSLTTCFHQHVAASHPCNETVLVRSSRFLCVPAVHALLCLSSLVAAKHL